MMPFTNNIPTKHKSSLNTKKYNEQDVVYVRSLGNIGASNHVTHTPASPGTHRVTFSKSLLNRNFGSDGALRHAKPSHSGANAVQFGSLRRFEDSESNSLTDSGILRQDSDDVSSDSGTYSSDMDTPQEVKNGQTFLMAACAQGKADVVRKLLENDVEINSVDYDDWSALHYACKEGQFECMLLLLDNGANLEQRDVGGWTPLMWACYKGRSAMVRTLLDRGANVHVKGEHHMSCIIWAAGRGHTDVVEMLLEKGAKVNTTDKYGTSPLVWAARKGHVDTVHMLLEANANVDIAGMYSWTPLIIAAKQGFVEVVRLILDYNPNINSVDKDGFTALTCAVRSGHMEVVEDLLENGAYVNIVDKDGDSILIHAVRGGHIEIVNTILRKFADVDVQGSESKTALYHAVEKGYYEIVKTILAYDPDLEVGNKDGETPLMKAVRTRHTDIVDLLLHKGSKVIATDKKGDTSLHLALRGRSRKVTELLLRNPKNSRLLYRPNKNGETPYMIDSNHQKSILTQIYGARNLNASEANENLLGYELYSSTIADVLSEPTLCTPITVGLYAKWGSGKSFLLDKLKTEMELFEHQTIDKTLKFSPLLLTFCSIISLLLGVVLGLVSGWPTGLGVGVGVEVALLSFFGIVWFGTNVKVWDSAYKISMYLGSKFDNLKLLLQVVFCHAGEVSKDTSLVRYLFTGNTKLTTFSGEQSIAMMVATLADEMEKEIGTVTARMFRVFKPSKGSSRKYRSMCCIPNFIIVIFILLSMITAIILVGLFPMVNYGDDDEPLISTKPIFGTLIALSIIIGFALVGNVYTWWQILSALSKPQSKRVMEAMNNMKSSKVEKFIQTLKEEVTIMTDMVRSLNGFTGNQYRFVVFVDGLDSSEQEKLLQVLDMVNILFSEMESPFVIILAVDPHIIIKGIEQNLPSLFRDSNINGHDYLRNVVHFPVFLQNQGLPIQRLLRQPSRQNCHEINSYTNHISRESPPKRQESVMSSASLEKMHRAGRKKKDSKFSFTGSVSNYFASATDLSKTLSKNDYFSDVNPRSMRRLMNIVAITARLLRAYNIDYSWHRLATWVNITEQWPYRTSWIIWYFEDNENLDEAITLKDIYDKVLPKIPLTRDVEPLLEIDRNVKKFEAFLSNNSPMLSVSDIKKFMPSCINLDPFLRKRIREYMKAYDQLQDFPLPTSYPRLGGSDSTASVDGRMRRVSGEPTQTSSHFSPNKSTIPPAYPPFPMMMPPTTPMLRMPYVVPTHHHPSLIENPSCIIGGTKKIFLRGGVPKIPLSSMSLTDVCQLLSKLEGLGTTAMDKYQTVIFENNVNGFVLYNCDIDELKPVIGMNFGDWQLFKAMILALRAREEESASGVPSTDRYMNQYVALSSENLSAASPDLAAAPPVSTGTHVQQLDFDKEKQEQDTAQREGFSKIAEDDQNRQNVNADPNRKEPRRLCRINSMAQQVQMESMFLNDVIDEFSEGSDDASSSDSPVFFAVDSEESITTPASISPHAIELDPAAARSFRRSSMRQPDKPQTSPSPFGSNSHVQFMIPDEGVHGVFSDAKLSQLPPDQLAHCSDIELQVRYAPSNSSTCTTEGSDEDLNISPTERLIKLGKGTKTRSEDFLSDHSEPGEAESAPLLGKKTQKKSTKETKSRTDARPKSFKEPLFDHVEMRNDIQAQVHAMANSVTGYDKQINAGGSSGGSQTSSSNASVESMKMSQEFRQDARKATAQSSRDSSPTSNASAHHQKFSVTEVKIDMPVSKK